MSATAFPALDHRTGSSHQHTEPYTPAVPAAMLIVTQVAPYVDGPAGVHGVLGQATTALPSWPSWPACSPHVVDDVRDLSPNGWRRPASSRSSPSARPRRDAPTQTRRHRSLVAAPGGLGILGVHSATDAYHGWPEYGDHARGPLRRPPLDPVLRHRRGRPGRTRPRPTWASGGGGATRSTCSTSCGPTPRSCSDWPPTRSTSPSGRARPRVRVPAGLDRRRRRRGRTFYSALGHFPGAWESPAYLQPPGRGPRLADGERLA